MALHIRDAVIVDAAVATRSRAYCRSMEDHRRKFIIPFLKRLKNLIGSLGHHQHLTHCWHHGTRHTYKVS